MEGKKQERYSLMGPGGGISAVSMEAGEFHLFGNSPGGDVPISRFSAQKAVPDAAAYHISFKAVFFQFFYDVFCLRGDGKAKLRTR